MINLEKLKPTKAASIFSCFANIFMVALSIFLLNRTLFDSLELWKMATICIGIVTPLLISSCIIGDGLSSPSSHKSLDDQEADFWTGGGLVCIVQLTFLILIGVLCQETLRTMYGMAAGYNLILSTYFLIKRKKKNKPVSGTTLPSESQVTNPVS